MGIGDWFKNIFGRESEKRDTTYTGTKPRTSLLQGAGGQESYDELIRRMSGQGVGYGGDYANKVSDPRIAKSRNRFEGQTLPELRSSLSASGRRGSSGGSDIVSRAYQNQGLDEDVIYSTAYREQEQQKRNEINQAVQDLQRFNLGDVGQTSKAAEFDYKDFQRLLGESTDQKQASDQLSIDALKGLMSGGQSLLSTQPRTVNTPTATSLPSATTGTIGQSGVPTLRGALGDPNDSAIDKLLRQMKIV